MSFEKAIEVVDKELEYLLNTQKEYIRQLNWFKKLEMDWRQIEGLEHTIAMLKHLSACISATERVKELLEFERKKE